MIKSSLMTAFLKKYLQFMLWYGRIPVFGGIAQLGERLTGSQEVMGSSPTISTKSLKAVML